MVPATIAEGRSESGDVDEEEALTTTANRLNGGGPATAEGLNSSSPGRRGRHDKWEEIREESKQVAGIALPIILTYALSMALAIEDQIFLGHLSPEALAAAALGNTYFNIAFFFIIGCATACDTLISQAFGARDYEGVEFWTKMGAFVITLICIPSMILFIVAEPVIKHVFRQPDDLARDAGKYTQLLAPGLLPFCLFIVIQKSLQAQNILMPSVWLGLLTNIFNVLGNYLFIHWLDWGFTGSPLATSSSRIISFIMITVYYLYIRKRGTLHQGEGYAMLSGGDDGDIPDEIMDQSSSSSTSAMINGNGVVQDAVEAQPQPNAAAAGAADEEKKGDKIPFGQAFKKFLALALPGGIMLGLEAWSFDWTIIIAAHFGDIALDAHQSVMSISAFTYLTMPLALSIAATIRVGNLLGAQKPHQARIAALICMTISTSCMLLYGLLVLVLRHDLGKMFSPNAEVVDLVARLCPIMALYQVLDGFQGTAGGVLRGMGKQKRIALLNFCAFWVLGLPVGAVMALYTSVGVFGLWWGFVIGLSVLCCLYFYALTRVDFQAEAVKALEAVTDLNLEHAWEEKLEYARSMSSLSADGHHDNDNGNAVPDLRKPLLQGVNSNGEVP